MQRSRSGAYVKNISDISLFTLWTTLKDEGKVPSLMIKKFELLNIWQTAPSLIDMYTGQKIG